MSRLLRHHALSVAHSVYSRTSQQLFAIWQPAWPTVHVCCQFVVLGAETAVKTRSGRSEGAAHTVQADNFTHVGGDV